MTTQEKLERLNSDIEFYEKQIEKNCFEIEKCRTMLAILRHNETTNNYVYPGSLQESIKSYVDATIENIDEKWNAQLTLSEEEKKEMRIPTNDKMVLNEITGEFDGI